MDLQPVVAGKRHVRQNVVSSAMLGAALGHPHTVDQAVDSVRLDAVDIDFLTVARQTEAHAHIYSEKCAHSAASG